MTDISSIHSSESKKKEALASLVKYAKITFVIFALNAVFCADFADIAVHGEWARLGLVGAILTGALVILFAALTASLVAVGLVLEKQD